ncbi:MAG: T9SS type A sorting domain-containing protein [Bacteroidia bacterium]|nr:T9SS type A sorting domain-containing protein [Bacteroidia bacterium]
MPFSGFNFLFAQANQSNYTLNTHRVYRSIHYHRPNYATQFINDTVLATTHWFRLSNPSTLPYCTSMWWLNAKTFDTLSQKVYGNPNADILGTSIIPLANKDVLVSGFTDTLNIFGDPMPYDAFLMRLDSAGNVKFCQSIGTHGHDNMYLTKVGQKYYYIGSSFNGVAPTSSVSVLYMAEVDITNGTINKAYKMDYGSYGVLSYEPSVQQSKIYIPCMRLRFAVTGEYRKACYFLLDTNGIISKQYIQAQASNGYWNSYPYSTISDSLKNIFGVMNRWNNNSDPYYNVIFKLDSNLVGCYPSDVPYSFTTTVATGDFHSLPMSITITRDSLHEVFGTINQGHGFNTIVDECVGYVGVKEEGVIENQHFKIYPNPSNGLFTYELVDPTTMNADYTMEVYNSVGSMIKRYPLVKNTLQGSIDLSEFSEGIYFVNILNANTIILNTKLNVIK